MTEHAESEYGYIFAQAYPKLKYIDICLADTGITLLGGYKKANMPAYSELDAIQMAIEGQSTKNLPAAENRGYGIRTSRNMLVNGLCGQYLLASGGACFGHTAKGSNCIELPFNIRFDGTIVAIRVPYKENISFKFSNYLE